MGGGGGGGIRSLGSHLGGMLAMVKTPMVAITRGKYNRGMLHDNAESEVMKHGAMLHKIPVELYASEKNQYAELVVRKEKRIKIRLQ